MHEVGQSVKAIHRKMYWFGDLSRREIRTRSLPLHAGSAVFEWQAFFSEKISSHPRTVVFCRQPAPRAGWDRAKRQNLFPQRVGITQATCRAEPRRQPWPVPRLLARQVAGGERLEQVPALHGALRGQLAAQPGDFADTKKRGTSFDVPRLVLPTLPAYGTSMWRRHCAFSVSVNRTITLPLLLKLRVCA